YVVTTADNRLVVLYRTVGGARHFSHREVRDRRVAQWRAAPALALRGLLGDQCGNGGIDLAELLLARRHRVDRPRRTMATARWTAGPSPGQLRRR
ncbi:MAG: hypothetical protein ABWY19_14740, partial [Marmoricola sp.]